MTFLRRAKGALQGIRRDGALRLLPKCLGVGAGMALLLSAAYASRAFGDPPAAPAPLTVVLWCALAPFVAIGQGSGRCRRFDMALPLSARRLWLVHVAAVLLGGAAIVAVSAALVVAIGGLAGRLLGLPAPPLDLLRLAVRLAAGLALAVAVLESSGPTLARVPQSRGRVLLAVVSLAGVLGVLLLLSALPLVWTLVPLGLAAALGVRTYRSLPAAFTLVPLAADSGAAAADRSAALGWDAAGAGRRAGWRRGVRLAAWVAGGPTAWLAYPMIFFVGMLVGGLLQAWTGERDLIFQNLILAIYALLTFSGLMTGRLPLFDPLPIRRRHLFAALVLPSLAALVLGWGAGRIALVAFGEPGEPIGMVERDSGYYVRVPAGHFEIAWDGRPPAVGSPWGESLVPDFYPLIRGSRAGLYSPVPTFGESSPEYFALQISRAVEAVYGQPIPAAEILERYLEVDADGRAAPRGEGLTLAADHPGLEPRDAGPAFPVVLPLVVLPWLLLFSVVLRCHRASVAPWLQQTVFWGLVAALFALMLAHVALAIADIMEPWVMRGFLEIFIRRLGASWPGTLAAWLGSALLLSGGYVLARAGFERVELPAAPREKKTLWSG